MLPVAVQALTVFQNPMTTELELQETLRGSQGAGRQKYIPGVVCCVNGRKRSVVEIDEILLRDWAS